MTSKKFQYPSYIRWFMRVFNVLGILTPLYFMGSFFITAFQTGNPVSNLIWLVVVLRAVLIGVFLILTANYFCEITADKDGLWITFMWKKIRVRWQNIVEIKPTIFNIGGGATQSWIVLVNGLTPFHRLYGLMYGLSLLPGFVVGLPISNSEELLKLMKDHLRVR